MRFLFFVLFFFPLNIFCQDFTIFNQSNIECEYFEYLSDWGRVNSVDTCKSNHDWTFAKASEVNPNSGITTAQYCPCSCGGSYVEARICRKCKSHEKRTKSYGYSQKIKRSEYSVLLDSIPKR
jgi:hypothetical protein